jgi:WD40 repeat protein
MLLGIWWLEKGCWSAAGNDHTLKLLNPDLTVRKVLAGHSRQITQVLQIAHPPCFLSSGMDGVILVWDLFSEDKLAELYHLKDELCGVKGLAFSDNWGHMLVSWSFSKRVNVWCPQISLSQGLMGQILGHS